jgi:hypothetical protein
MFSSRDFEGDEAPMNSWVGEHADYRLKDFAISFPVNPALSAARVGRPSRPNQVVGSSHGSPYCDTPALRHSRRHYHRAREKRRDTPPEKIDAEMEDTG